MCSKSVKEVSLKVDELEEKIFLVKIETATKVDGLEEKMNCREKVPEKELEQDFKGIFRKHQEDKVLRRNAY